MPRACSICSHQARDQINAALVVGDPYRNVAERFEASPQAVYRHRLEHLPVALVKAQEAVEVARADSLLDQVRQLHRRALSILTHAEEAGDLRTALLGIGQARGCLELLAKLQGEIDSGSTTVNVMNVAAEWPMLRQRITAALEPYPEARGAVLASLNGHADR